MPSPTHRTARSRTYAIVAITAVAALLRLPQPQGRSLYADAERLRDLAVLRGMAHGVAATAGPPSSLGGFHFGPLYYGILYPFAAAFRFAPYSLAVASMVFSLATVAGCAYLAHRLWNDRLTTFAVAGVMAFSAFDAYFASYASNPNFVPFFTVLFFVTLERLMSDDAGPAYAALLGGAMAAAAQLHAVPLVALPLVLLAAIATKKLRITAARTAAFLSAAVVVALPYLGYLLSHGGTGLAAIAMGAPPVAWHVRLADYLTFWVSLLVSLHPFFDIAAFVPLPMLLAGIALLALPVVPLLRWRTAKSGRPPASRAGSRTVLALWLAVPTAVLLVPFGALPGLRIYYMLMLAPAAFLLFGRGLALLVHRGHRAAVAYLAIVYVVVQLAQLCLYHALVAHLA